MADSLRGNSVQDLHARVTRALANGVVDLKQHDPEWGEDLKRLLKQIPAMCEYVHQAMECEYDTAGDAKQAIIRKHLLALADDLGQFPQTTHGVMWAGIENAAFALVACWQCPNEYTVSDLSQKILLAVGE